VPAPRSTAKAIATRKLPQLGGHRFTPSVLTLDPFITTYVRNSTGLGIALETEAEVGEAVGDTVTTLKGDVLFLLLEFQYQQALGDWLALRAGISASARTGTNDESLVAQGISAINGFEFGALFRLRTWERVTVSASTDYRSTSIFLASLREFARAAIESGSIRQGSGALLTKAQSNRFVAGVRLAYAPRPWLGLLAAAEGGVGDPLRDVQEKEGVFAAGGAVSIDLAARHAIPIGLLFTGMLDSFPANGDDLAQNVVAWGWGISYTGRDEFSLGAEFSYSKLELQESDATIDGIMGRAKLRYYF
jgi:hypothetical protein